MSKQVYVYPDGAIVGSSYIDSSGVTRFKYIKNHLNMINYEEPWERSHREEKLESQLKKSKRIKDLMTQWNKLSKNEKQLFKQFISK